ncbi:site-specific integrase, partial [Candidatus Bathyarchaeota archaeon]|nr:site-specific integrase [Candidatus Bathyarchaeota archaeon]
MYMAEPNLSSPSMDIALNEWLVRQKGRYKQKCEMSFNKFMAFIKERLGWTEVSGDIILSKHVENRKSEDKRVKYLFDDLIQPFMTWIEEHGNSHNSAVVQVGMVRGFFKYYRERLEVQDPIGFNETKKRYHAYSRDELVKMVEVGDLESRALIMLGVQLGIRVNDFVSMKRQPIIEAYQNANGEFPLEFEIETSKEKVISIGHISKEVYDSLKLYWDSIPPSEYVFPWNGTHIIDQRANDILKNCWIRTFPDRKIQKIRFHELRSFKISTFTNLGINQWAIMKMTGKKVTQDINIYLTSLNLKELFMKAENILNLTRVVNVHGIDELRRENKDLKEEIYDVKKSLEVFQRDIEELKQFKSEMKFLKEGNIEVVYTGEDIKEEMKEEIRQIIRQKQKEQTANS